MQKLLRDYHRKGEFAPQDYEGSFTVLLLDANRGSLRMFRNLVGNRSTYYQRIANGLVFGSNLALLARSGSAHPRVNQAMLPVYFLYRFVPGRNTLFDGINRLQPGELLTYENGQVCVEQVQTFADFDEPEKTSKSASVERLEATMAEILRDYWELAPDAACLLSGGVDSCYIQAHWNHIDTASGQNRLPRSAAVWLNHAHTLPERDYTQSAVTELKTDHLSVRVDKLSTSHIHTILAQTGEMPNHAQSFHFVPLAEAMAAHGMTTGLCGEGADGLFGSDAPFLMRSAARLKQERSSAITRRVLSWAASLLGKSFYAEAVHLSQHVEDPTWFRHPVNLAGAFSDLEFFVRSFGMTGLLEAQHYRRQLLVDYDVPKDDLYLQWISAASFLTESVGTAAYWNQLFALHGVQMLHPFMDSRMMRVALNVDLPVKFATASTKQVLKAALARHVSPKFVARPKLAFGQPVFQWLSNGGTLRAGVEDIAEHDFLDRRALKQALRKPNWFLWNLLVYDLWYKEFVAA